MSTELKILFVEDVQTDAELAMRNLVRGGIKFQSRVVETETDFLRELDEFSPDLIISDYKMPKFDGMTALNLTLEKRPNIPFLLLTGSINEEIAVECIKTGATDYILKEHITRLPTAVKDAFEKNKIVLEKERITLALKESEERFRMTLEETKIGTFDWDLKNDIFYVSPTYYTMLGYNAKEGPGDREEWLARVHPDDKNIVAKKIHDVISGGDSKYQYEIRVKDANGSYRWINVVGRIIESDENNKPTRMIGIRMDITERKKVEEELKESEAKFRSLADDSPNMIFINKNGRVVYVNKKCEEILGYTKEEFLNPKFNFLDLIAPEYVEIVKENFAKRYEGKAKDSYEYALISKDKRRIETFISNKIINYEGEKAILGIVTDITERRLSEIALQESEERFRHSFDYAATGMCIVGIDMKFQRVNNAFRKMIGYEEAEIKKLTFPEITYKEDRTIGLSQFQKMLSGENDNASFEKRYVKKDGSLICAHVTTSLVRNVNSQPQFFITHIIDITEKKKSEKEIALLANAMKSVNECVSITNLKDELLFVNQSLLKTYGYTEKEVLGKHISIFQSPNNPPEIIKEILPATLKEGWQGELLNIRKDGSEFPISLSTTIIYDNEKNPVALIGVVADISERKFAEDALKDSEDRYRDLVEHSSELFCTHDLKGNILSLNDAGVKTLGYSRDEILKTNLREFIVPEFRRLFKSYLIRIKEEGKVSGTMVVQTKSGERRIWEFNNSLRTLGVATPIVRGMAKDITEQHRAEAEISMLAHALKSVNEYVSITDLKENFIFVNDSFLKTYGFDEHELLGKDMAIIRSSNNPPDLVGKILPATLAGGWQGELLNKRKDGSEFPVSLSTTMVRDKKGATIALIQVASDITHRRQAEEIITNERTLLRTIIDLIPDAVFVKDISGRKILANKKEIELSGKKSENDVIGKTDFELYPESEAKYFAAEDHQVIESGKPLLDIEGKLVDMEGHEHWLIGAKVPLRDVHGKITGLVGVNHDFTERKQYEDELLKLSRAVEQSPASVVITDPQGNIEFVNTKFCEVSGFSKDEVLGKNPRIIKSGFHDKQFYSELWDNISSGKEWSGEFLNKKRNGEKYWESARISPVINKEGDITHFIAIKEDITEKKKMIEEVIIAKDKAEEMNRLKSNFLANMSHELRTPLNGILGYAEILTTSLGDAEHVEMVQGIYQSGKRLSETLKFILDLSEAETGKMEVIAKDISVVPIIKESVQHFRSDAAIRNLKLETIINDENIIAHLDEILLKRILHNLLDNAIKFTKVGSIKVEVGYEEVKGEQKASPMFFIKITDTGIGIPEDKIDLIWEEFRQVSEGISRNYEGPGLGLTISKKAVELMKGNITVESKFGEGSTFTVRFPSLSQKTIITGKDDENSKFRNLPIDKSANKILQASVLYVEDDFINRNMVKLFLKDTCDVETAEDGLTALKLLNEKKYDFFMIDINLGEGMNGLELVKEILKIPHYVGTPIAAVTAYAMGKDKSESLQAGCTHYLAKPFRKKEMIELVKKALLND